MGEEVNQQLQYEIDSVMPESIRTGLFVSLFTLLAPPAAQGPTGNPTGMWMSVAGVTNIPCMDAPPSPTRVQANEIRQMEEIMAMGLRHVLLSQCFVTAPTTWVGGGYRATVDGTLYDICGVENDSQNQMNRVELKLVTL